MAHTESDRKAYLADRAGQQHAYAVAKWLQENPGIGCLNGGRYYIMIDNQQVIVPEFAVQLTEEMTGGNPFEA